MTGEAVVDQAAAEEEVVEEAVAVVGDAEAVEDKNLIAMKKLIVHSVPVVISFAWLAAIHQTFNPVILKGPDFLRFYLILILGFYVSIFILNTLKETVSKTTFYFAGLIFLLGSVKLTRGIMLGKPVGFLVMILIAECIVAVFFIPNHINKKKN